MFCRDEDVALFNLAIANDTEFLCQINAMDYSLLVGVDPESGKLWVGIIDYLYQYNMLKRAENLVKEAGRELKLHGDVTVQRASAYKDRFVKALSTYFCPMPTLRSSSVEVPEE